MPSIEPGVYPRTYGLSAGGKWMVGILGAFLVTLSLGGAILFFLDGGDRASAGSGTLFVLCGVFACLGAYLLAAAFFYRVILQADSIEVFEIYRRRRLARGEIEGRSHFANARGPSGWVLVPKPGFGGKIKLSMYLKTDKDFLAWIHALPDLDLEKKRTAEFEKAEAIAALKARGFSHLALKRLSAFASGLNWVVYGLGLASFFVDDSHHVLTWGLIALPWFGILLVAHFAPYYRFAGPKKSSQPDLSLPLVLPGAFLVLQTLRALNPVGWENPLALTVLVSVILVGVAFWCDPWLKKHLGTTALVFILCCGYGYGAGLQVNALLDRSKPEYFRVLVTDKYVSHGRSTSYHLRLAPWGPEVSGQNLMVSYSKYARTKPGDTVCMVLRGGALGVAWSAPGYCDVAY